jgi:hypothetical protein
MAIVSFHLVAGDHHVDDFASEQHLGVGSGRSHRALDPRCGLAIAYATGEGQEAIVDAVHAWAGYAVGVIAAHLGGMLLPAVATASAMALAALCHVRGHDDEPTHFDHRSRAHR